MLAAKTPSVFLIYHVFYRGLVLFELYRRLGSDQRLEDAREMLYTFEMWAKECSMEVFQPKYLLLKAECHSSINEYEQSEQVYKASIRAAKDQGLFHELALSHELLGNFYSGHGNHLDSIQNYKQAYLYCNQWGAVKIANQLMNKHGLIIGSSDTDLSNTVGGKRSR